MALPNLTWLSLGYQGCALAIMAVLGLHSCLSYHNYTSYGAIIAALAAVLPSLDVGLIATLAGRIRSWQQLAGGVSGGCPGGAQWSCGYHLHPIQLGFHGNPYFKKIDQFFSCACGYVVDWPHVAQVRFWRPKRPHLERRHAIWG